MHLIMKTKVVSYYLSLETRVQTLKKSKKVIWGSVRTPPNLGSAQKSENSSTLGLQYTVKKNTRNVLLGTIQEPMERAFRNTHYFIQSTLSICPKFGNFQKNSTKKFTVNS